MSKVAGLWGGNAGVVLGFVVAGAVLFGGYLYLADAVDAPEEVALVAPEPAPEAKPQSEPTSSEPTSSEPAPESSEQIAEPAEPIAPEAVIPAPRFDLVRVEQDGTTLIAGKAAPDTEVVIVMDGKEFGRVTSDGSGAFVSFLSIPGSQDPRVLSLVSRHANGDVTSEDQVILAPTPAPDVVASIAEAPSNTDEAGPESAAGAEEPSGTVETAAQEPDQLAASATLETPAIAPSPNPVTVLRADADGVEVLQPATSDTTPEAMTSVALDAISYTDIGDVSLSGRAPDQGSVRVYLDNAPIATLDVDNTGRWRGDLPQVETGVYTLRIDQVDASGAVTSRVETPFKREGPAVLSAALAQAGKSGAQVRAVTVQTGATLWAIARDRYGDGTLYVRVFDANRESIRDPHLIYPGQVFALPE